MPRIGEHSIPSSIHKFGHDKYLLAVDCRMCIAMHLKFSTHINHVSTSQLILNYLARECDSGHSCPCLCNFIKNQVTVNCHKVF